MASRAVDSTQFSVVQPAMTTEVMPLLRSTRSRLVPQKPLERYFLTTTSPSAGSRPGTNSWPREPSTV